MGHACAVAVVLQLLALCSAMVLLGLIELHIVGLQMYVVVAKLEARGLIATYNSALLILHMQLCCLSVNCCQILIHTLADKYASLAVKQYYYTA